MCRISLIVVAVVLGVFAQCATSADYTPEKKAELLNLIKGCASENGVSDDDLKKLRSGQDISNKHTWDYILCLGLKTGFMHDNSDFKVDVIVGQIPELTETETRDILEKCGSEKGSTPAESAFLKYKCSIKNLPKPIFILSGGIE